MSRRLTQTTLTLACAAAYALGASRADSHVQWGEMVKLAKFYGMSGDALRDAMLKRGMCVKIGTGKTGRYDVVRT